jgi:hypothetical protein
MIGSWGITTLISLLLCVFEIFHNKEGVAATGDEPRAVSMLGKALPLTYITSA